MEQMEERLYQCNDCGLEFDDPDMKRAAVRKIHGKGNPYTDSEYQDEILMERMDEMDDPEPEECCPNCGSCSIDHRE